MGRVSVRAWIIGLIAAAIAAGPARAAVMSIAPDGSISTESAPSLHYSVLRHGEPIRHIVTQAASAPGSDLGDTIRSAAVHHAVSAELVAAVAWRESRFQASARSLRGAQGVMQLMPGTARSLGVDPNDTTQNVEGGAGYLQRLLTRYDGDIVKTLAAYNAGPGAVDRYGGVPPYAETRAYVSAILDHLAEAAR